MFLFKKKKDDTQEKTALEKTEAAIKAAKEIKKEKTKAEAEQFEQDAPMKVVIPASSLLEDEDELPVKEPEEGKSGVSEEDVDKLLVAVNQNMPDIEVPDISLEILAPSNEKVEKNKQSSNKPESMSEVKIEARQETKPEIKTEPKTEIKTDAKPEKKVEIKTEAKAEIKTEIKTEMKTPEKTGTKPETKTETKQDAKAEAKPVAGEPEKDKKAGSEEKENLFSNLFGGVEVEEDNPLKRLISSLPEVSIDEVMNEAEEVKGLMSEWYVNRGKNVIK